MSRGKGERETLAETETDVGGDAGGTQEGSCDHRGHACCREHSDLGMDFLCLTFPWLPF